MWLWNDPLIGKLLFIYQLSASLGYSFPQFLFIYSPILSEMSAEFVSKSLQRPEQLLEAVAVFWTVSLIQG